MKRIFVCILLGMLAVSAAAQYRQSAADVIGEDYLYRHKGRLKTVQGGAVISMTEAAVLFSDVNGEDLGGRWKQNVHLYRSGKGLLIAGSVVAYCGMTWAVSGRIVSDASEQELYPVSSGSVADSRQMQKMGITVMSVGAALIAAGVPMVCIGRRGMDEIIGSYNHPSRDVSLMFGAQNHGVGFSVEF